MKLPMLKSGLKMAGQRIQAMQQSRNPEAERRIRGRKWMTIRARWLSDHPLCAACEAKGYTKPANQLDHVIPLIDGGKDDDSNYQSLCEPCHIEKTAKEAKAR